MINLRRRGRQESLISPPSFFSLLNLRGILSDKTREAEWKVDQTLEKKMFHNGLTLLSTRNEEFDSIGRSRAICAGKVYFVIVIGVGSILSQFGRRKEKQFAHFHEEK